MESNLSSFNKIEQTISGSRKTSNYIIGGMLTIGKEWIKPLILEIYLVEQNE